MFSKALLHILGHDVLGEGFMDLTGTETYAVSRAYDKLSQNSDLLTGFEASLVERAVKGFKEYYSSEEQTQIDADMKRIRKVQWKHTPSVVKQAKASSKRGL